MTNRPLTTVNYEDRTGKVSWLGVSMSDEGEFHKFLSEVVGSRLEDAEGVEEFETHLHGLTSTDFGNESLKAVLAAAVSEERAWAVGEAVAEAYLSQEYNVTWPWNMERDKRNPYASLPGADLIGFKVEGGSSRLVLGEVKSSSEDRCPPQVMNGRSGIGHQLDDLATNLGSICQLLKWLLPRCKNTEHEETFNKAIALYLESGNKAVVLFGVLIRDTQPNVKDLKKRGYALAENLREPTTCHLIAIYLPCAICELSSRISGGG